MGSSFFCPYCCSTAGEVRISGGRTAQIPMRVLRPPPAESSGLKEESTFDRAKVLCIDDDSPAPRLGQGCHRNPRVRSLDGTDGPSGLALAKAQRPDIILVDVMMPKMSGFEVCQHLRADPKLKGIPIIIITAMGRPRPSRRRALRLGPIWPFRNRSIRLRSFF